MSFKKLTLKECKKELASKIEAKKREEYQKKYYGKIVLMSDLLIRAGASK